jgi:ABC-type transport system involved in multi-copper enzyme maturation permease subunit
MTWLAYRQFRAQALLAALTTIVIVVLLVVTREAIAHDPSNLSAFQQSVRLLGTALVGVPALLGAFWGAPLVAREFEAGTHLLAWTQSVTRARWLATKLAITCIAAIAATALFSAVLTWWAAPLDRLGNRIGTANFGQRGIVPIGYTLFAITLGALLGTVLKRTLPAMAATLGSFFVVRFVVQLAVRPHLFKSVLLAGPTRAFGSTDVTSPTSGAWVLSSKTVDATGRAVSSIDNMLADACALTRSSSQADFAVCANRLGIRDIVTMHPANRFWAMQTYETAIFLALALALAALCFLSVRRRHD